MVRNAVVAATLVLAFAACGGGGGGRTGSNHVWVSDSSANVVYGFSFEQLAATGAPSPDIGIGTGAASQTYDATMGPGSSLWVALPGQNVVAKFSATQLEASGSPAPAATVAAPFPDHLAFDAAGNLWVTRADGSYDVRRFAKADIAGPGPLTPTASLTLTPGIAGLSVDVLFDTAGHLWVIDKGDAASVGPRYMRAPDSLLTATGTATLTPEVTITSTGQTYAQAGAFDAAGALWVATLNGGSTLLNRYSPSQLASSGSKTPEARITVTGSTSLGVIAFDASGALWIADFNGRKLFRLPASQLVGSGAFTVDPDVVITAPAASGNGLTGIAFDPTPAGLPLAQ